MPRISVDLILVIVLSSAILGQPVPERGCTVTGRVAKASDGTPLRNARVSLVALSTRKDAQNYSTKTDSNGSFAFKQVAPGQYQLFARKTGFVEQSYR